MPISKNRKVIINNIFVIMINKYRKFKFNNFFLSSLPSFVKQHISFKRKIFGYSYNSCPIDHDTIARYGARRCDVCKTDFT